MVTQSYGLGAGSPMQRVLRKPQHRFVLQNRPWQIQVAAIAPVLPGETLKNLLLQSRVVSDPLKNALLGWWLEYYVFYVKVSDLDQPDYMPGITGMFLDPTFDMSSYVAGAADSETFAYAGGVDWAKECRDLIVREYFRNPDDGNPVIGSNPIAAINEESWMNSITSSDDMASFDMDVDLNADSTITTSEIERATALYNQLLMGGMTQMTYQDFLKSYGVSVPAEQLKRPELLRYVRDWTYPSNTVDPATGIPNSAAVWSVSERADKARFFREPGFVVVVQVARPKVYMGNQKGSASCALDNAMSWLPAVLSNDPNTSIRTFTGTAGPLKGNSAPYTVDMKDLFIYGDYFYNALPAGTGGIVALPLVASGTANVLYPSSSDADNLFKDNQKHYLRADGVVSLSIAGNQQDTTPTGADL